MSSQATALLQMHSWTKATELREARGRSHTLSRSQGKALEVVELGCCLDSEEVRRSWVLNPRMLELRSFGGSRGSGRYGRLLRIQEGCLGKLEKPESALDRSGALFYRWRKTV